MLKFFRNLPAGKAGNKVTRYLAYAIGEIFLVVIGILIALQVNNWNEQRKSREAETNFYTALLYDLEKEFMQKSEFESYLVGDLGRAFHSIARLDKRRQQIDSLQTEINLFLPD